MAERSRERVLDLSQSPANRQDFSALSEAWTGGILDPLRAVHPGRPSMQEKRQPRL